MRRHLSGSVYLWACGEKANDEDDEPKLFDRLIGWLILLVSAVAFEYVWESGVCLLY